MIFYVFLDGVGFGEKNPDKNPFSKFSEGFFRPMGGYASALSQCTYLETDAAMGISGLPQSATGQTSLWTGINGPQALGRHLSGFPTFTLKKIIAEHSIIKVLNENGVRADLLNCYSPIFFQRIKKYPRLVSASTLVQMASNRPLKSLEDLEEGNGLYMDITHEILKEMAKDQLPADHPLLVERDPYEVGKSIPKRFSDYGVCLYEYFITDKIGHDQNWEYAKKVIFQLERFIQGYLDGMDPEKDSLIVTSDHGNLEDLSTNRHTAHPVATVLAGKIRNAGGIHIRSLADIPHTIYNFLGLNIPR
jgi:hypothetical protein